MSAPRLLEMSLPWRAQGITVLPIPDPMLAAAAAEGLVWVPAYGMGYLAVREAPYDAAYFAKYEAYAATEMGKAITAARVALVRRHVRAFSSLVDVGIGCGDFLQAIGTKGLLPAGFDINPLGVAWLLTRGLLRDPRAEPADVLTFWDSLEHIEDAADFLAAARSWVFCSLPIVPGEGPPRADWRHLRPTEHTYYWTRDGLIRWMAANGFACVEHSTAESLLGREDIGSFAFRRVP